MPPASRFTRKPLVAMMAVAASATPTVAAAASAARVAFAVGNVEVVSATGKRQDLGRGDTLEAGDTLSTGFGLAQIRFTDGAFMSVKPNSELKIDDYHFEGKDDAKARTFLSLIKGGLRALTGAVGKSRRSNYRLRTAVATIGIRGTAYSVEYGNSIRVHVEGGSVEVLDRASEEQVLMILDQWQSGIVDDDGNAIAIDGDLDLFATLDESGELESIAVYSAGDEDDGKGPIAILPAPVIEEIAPIIDGGEGAL